MKANVTLQISACRLNTNTFYTGLSRKSRKSFCAAADSEFDFALDVMKDSDWAKEDERREIEEWGSTLTSRGTDACIFDTDGCSDIDYMIIVRQNSCHSQAEILKHELSHIAKGDLSLPWLSSVFSCCLFLLFSCELCIVFQTLKNSNLYYDSNICLSDKTSIFFSQP